MRKTIVYCTMFLLVAGLAFAASISRDLPRRADPNSELTVKLRVTGADTSGLLTLEEELPSGIAVKEWTLTGAKEAKSAINTRVQGNRYGWSFTPSSSSATLEYKIDLSNKDATFGTLVFFDKSGQGKVDSQTLRVALVTCGDGICESPENSDSCEADCPKPAPPPTPQKPTEEIVKEKSNAGWLIIAAIVIIGMIIAYFAVIKKKKE